MLEIPVTELIPQRFPMIMISAVEEHRDKFIRTQLSIQEENIFVQDGLFSESGMLENVAQTAAAHVGLVCKAKGIPVPVGFIGSMDKVELFGYAPSGSQLATEVDVVQEVFNVSIIEGRVYLKDELLLKCKMKIVIDP